MFNHVYWIHNPFMAQTLGGLSSRTDIIWLSSGVSHHWPRQVQQGITFAVVHLIHLAQREPRRKTPAELFIVKYGE